MHRARRGKEVDGCRFNNWEDKDVEYGDIDPAKARVRHGYHKNESWETLREESVMEIP